MSRRAQRANYDGYRGVEECTTRAVLIGMRAKPLPPTTDGVDKEQVSNDYGFFFSSGGMFLDPFYPAVISSPHLALEATPVHSRTRLDV